MSKDRDNQNRNKSDQKLNKQPIRDQLNRNQNNIGQKGNLDKKSQKDRKGDHR